MREAKITVIDGKSFQISTWTNKKAKRILTKLFKLLGESLVMLTEEAKAPQAISVLSQKLSDDELLELTKEIFETTFFDGQSVSENMETVFGINLLLESKVLIETLKYQYSDFFVGGAGIKGFINAALKR